MFANCATPWNAPRCFPAASLSCPNISPPASAAKAKRRAGVLAEPVDAQRLEEIERQAVLEALRKFNFNRTDTAKALGISRRALLYKLQRLRDAGFEVDPRPDGAHAVDKGDTDVI